MNNEIDLTEERVFRDVVDKQLPATTHKSPWNNKKDQYGDKITPHVNSGNRFVTRRNGYILNSYTDIDGHMIEEIDLTDDYLVEWNGYFDISRNVTSTTLGIRNNNSISYINYDFDILEYNDGQTFSLTFGDDNRYWINSGNNTTSTRRNYLNTSTNITVSTDDDYIYLSVDGRYRHKYPNRELQDIFGKPIKNISKHDFVESYYDSYSMHISEICRKLKKPLLDDKFHYSTYEVPWDRKVSASKRERLYTENNQFPSEVHYTPWSYSNSYLTHFIMRNRLSQPKNIILNNEKNLRTKYPHTVRWDKEQPSIEGIIEEDLDGVTMPEDSFFIRGDSRNRFTESISYDVTF